MRTILTFFILIFSVPAGPIAGFECASSAAGAFHFKDVIAKAEQMAHKPYQPPRPMPSSLSSLTFDQWRSIVFRNDKSPWPAGNNFVLQFYHLGYLYDQPVKINIINAQGVYEFPFSSQLFAYGNKNLAQEVPDNLGFAGFSLYYPLNQPKDHDEFLVFIGASYFRAVGKGQWFGLSARGIAIDTASPQGEQFPYFKEFWLARPAAGADSIKIYALLVGESITGAYRFGIYPGDQTVTDVESVIFLRKKVQKLGIAPFSSMFLQGSNSTRRYSTLAPQVHDSDGLSIQTRDNRWIWCPLQNPKKLAIQSFQLDNPGGFGLLQRVRRFCSYESLSLHYQDRPSAWVTAAGNWGKGSLQLFEIPTDTENNDNIVSFWVPAESPEPLKPIRFCYRISWQGNDMTRPSIGYVADTRTGRGNVNKAAREFEIDFTGGDLGTLSLDKVSAVINVESGTKLLEHHIVKNDFIRGLRLEFQIEPPVQPVHLRAYLRESGKAITETWSYRFHPD
jgi:glucans biosynthesis protein